MIKTTFQIIGQEQVISLDLTVTTMYPAIYLSILWIVPFQNLPENTFLMESILT